MTIGDLPTEPDENNPLRLEWQVCFPLYAATNLLQRLYRPLLTPLGLTYSQYLVMLVLWEQGSTSISELRNCLHLDVGTLSPLLKRMEQAGFIKRRRDSKDERRVLIALTEHGRLLHDHARGIPDTLAKQIDVAPEEMEHLRSETKALVSRLVAACA